MSAFPNSARGITCNKNQGQEWVVIGIVQQIRFWKKVTAVDERSCWVWQGAKDPSGYGKFGFRQSVNSGVSLFSHRVSFAIANGSCPADLYICHRCDNPPCVNPNHLFPGTAQDNKDDALMKRASKLTEAQVSQIRSDRSRGVSQRIIAGRFGVSQSIISLILSGKRWRKNP